MPPPRLVVLGAGFAGYSLLRSLPRDLVEATVVSPRNYFVFTPLLPSAVGGTVEFRSIVEPVRRRVRQARMREARKRLTFVVCGGGATGVELAAELHDLLADELREVFPNVARLARVVVLEATPRLLGGFDAALADYTREHFGRGGIDVRTSTVVAQVEADRVLLADGTEVRCGL